MRVKDKEEIIKTLEKIEPDDFEFIKVNYGDKHKCFGHLNKRPIDDLMGFMFDLSLSRRITSLSLVDGGIGYSSPLVIGTSESRDGTTNIDAEVIEAIGLVLKRRIDADFQRTKQYIRAREEYEKNYRDRAKHAKEQMEKSFEIFGDDLGMP